MTAATLSALLIGDPPWRPGEPTPAAAAARAALVDNVTGMMRGHGGFNADGPGAADFDGLLDEYRDKLLGADR